jgi:hypothetical protein
MILSKILVLFFFLKPSKILVGKEPANGFLQSSEKLRVKIR